MSYQKSPRQERLEDRARKAWPGQSVEVVSSEEGTVHVWGEGGFALLHVEHPLSDEVLGVLAREIGCMSIHAAIDAVEMILRECMNRHGLDVVGLREGRIIAWGDDGRQAATGGSLREVIENLHKRAREERRRNTPIDLPPSTRVEELLSSNLEGTVVLAKGDGK